VQVYVNHDHPNGISQAEWDRLDPKARGRGWRRMMRDAEVFVRGTVRHGDHKTVRLQGWHLVVMNTETQAEAMRHVAFLD
jgi:hypothetical protein